MLSQQSLPREKASLPGTRFRKAGTDEICGWAILAVVAVAFALRVYHLGFQSMWRDEVDALIFATRDLRSVLGNFTKIGENGPLYFLLLRFWVMLTGDSEFSLRFFSLFFGVLTPALAFSASSMLFNRQVGLFAGLLAAVSPYYIWYSQEAKMYALLAFLSLLSVFLLLRALEGRRWWLWVAYVIVTSLSLYIHMFSALMIVFEGILFLMGLRKWHSAWRPWAVSYGFLTLPYVPLAIWQLPTLLNPPPTAYPFVPLDGIASMLMFAWSLNSSPVPILFPFTFFVFLLLTGILLFRNREPSGPAMQAGGLGIVAPLATPLKLDRGVLIMVAYLVLPVLGFYIVSLRMPLFQDRYLIIVSPAYYLLLACGLVAVWRRSKLLLILCLFFVLSASAYSIWFQSQTKIKSDFKAAAQYFQQQSGGGEPILILMPYVQETFAYYHRSPLALLQAPYPNGGATADQIGMQLAQQVIGMKSVWLLLSEAELYDSRGLIKDWFDKNGRPVESATFARVSLYRYDFTAPGPR